MKITTLRLALTLSVLFNLGVVGALSWQQFTEHQRSQPGEPLLVRELQLNDEQRQRWQDTEEPFLRELTQSGLVIEQQRNQLIESIFAEQLDHQRIATAQTALAEQQNHQQRLVIDQLLREREILNGAQRQRLAQLLKHDSSLSSHAEMLHNE